MTERAQAGFNYVIDIEGAKLLRKPSEKILPSSQKYYCLAEHRLVQGFPFEPYPEEYNLEIIVYIKMRMSEFGFPVFFGEVNLKPLKKVFTIKP